MVFSGAARGHARTTCAPARSPEHHDAGNAILPTGIHTRVDACPTAARSPPQNTAHTPWPPPFYRALRLPCHDTTAALPPTYTHTRARPALRGLANVSPLRSPAAAHWAAPPSSAFSTTLAWDEEYRSPQLPTRVAFPLLRGCRLVSCCTVAGRLNALLRNARRPYYAATPALTKRATTCARRVEHRPSASVRARVDDTPPACTMHPPHAPFIEPTPVQFSLQTSPVVVRTGSGVVNSSLTVGWMVLGWLILDLPAILDPPICHTQHCCLRHTAAHTARIVHGLETTTRAPHRRGL